MTGVPNIPAYPGFPKDMVHPGYAPAVFAKRTAYGEPNERGAPARYPPVTVNAPHQEEEYRAKGYHVYGETVSTMTPYQEYPKMLVHPEHKDAIPDEHLARREGHTIITNTIPGSPEVYPAVFVKDAKEEEAWKAKGYGSPVKGDPEAFISAQAAPKHDSRPGIIEYPKWVNGELAKDETDEARILAKVQPVGIVSVGEALKAAIPEDATKAERSAKMKAAWVTRKAKAEARKAKALERQQKADELLAKQGEGVNAA